MRSILISFSLITSTVFGAAACQQTPDTQTETTPIEQPTEPSQTPKATPVSGTVEVEQNTPTTLVKEPKTGERSKQQATPAPPTDKPATVKTTSTETITSTTPEPAAAVEQPVPTPLPEQPAPTPAPAPVKTTPDHSTWDDLLQEYVSSSGKVNYKGLKNQAAKLSSYLDDLKNHPPTGDWSRAEQMAYWINAYNAFTVKLIIDNYPLASITNLHNGKPWDVKWIELGGKTYTLNNIENDILRPRYKDARIHFAVNCAAKSCPPLHNRAFTAANLESTLNSQAKKFINNSSYNTIAPKSVEVSKIFDWYAVDFGNLISYLNQYSSTQIQSGAKIDFMEYDWALNGY